MTHRFKLPQYKLAIVTGGLAGCAVAVCVAQKGLANDNQRLFVRNLTQLPINHVQADTAYAWPEGLRNHTAVLMDVSRNATCVRVTYPLAG